MFLFTLLGGVLVLEAAIAATQDERRYDAAILRTLGASQRQLTVAQLAEFLALGTLAGLVAAGGATAIGYVLADRAFQIPFHWNPWLWAIGIVGGAAGRGRRRLVRHAPHACGSRRSPCCASSASGPRPNPCGTNRRSQLSK